MTSRPLTKGEQVVWFGDECVVIPDMSWMDGHAFCGGNKPTCLMTHEDFRNRSQFCINAPWDMNAITCYACRDAIHRGIPNPDWSQQP